MKVLLFTSHYPNRGCPIRSVYNQQQAVALARHCEVRVAAPIQWYPVRMTAVAGPNPAPAYDETTGLPTWHPRFFLTPKVGRALYPLQMAACLLPFMRRLHREYPFDVMLATWAYPDMVAGALLAKWLGVPLLGKVHGSDVNVQATYPLRRQQVRWAIKRAYRVLAVSGALRERLVEIGVGPEKVMVYHNGVDQQRFCPRSAAEARRELGLPEEGRHVVYVGFLQEAKALHVLLQAVALRKRAGTLTYTTHLVGHGPLAEELRGLAESLQLGETVRFHGQASHDRVPVWMQAADVFCLPSIREGCPNVILEALACGRPVVATTVGGIPELIGPHNGILVPPSDLLTLADALDHALGREWDTAEIRRQASRFSWERSAAALYEAACGALEAGTARAVAPSQRGIAR